MILMQIDNLEIALEAIAAIEEQTEIKGILPAAITIYLVGGNKITLHNFSLKQFQEMRQRVINQINLLNRQQ